MHCATTGALGIDDNDDASMNPAPEPQGDCLVNSLTIFEQIQANQQTWKMYWMGSNCDTDWLNTAVFKEQYHPSHPTHYNVTQVPIRQLFSDLTNGTLPFYSFVMSFNDLMDTSMHPDSIVESGENLLACVYNALRTSRYWKNTLLIVNFDENGGMYDHKSVPPASPPDAGAPVATWQWSADGPVYSFDFSVLGLRVPVLLISPWLQAGICSNQYQNTSILRFLQDLLNPLQAGSLCLTQRDQNAPSIAPVFDYANFGLNEMRIDCPSNLPLYVGTSSTPVITEGEIIGSSEPTPEQLAAAPAPHIEKITKKYLLGLPGHPDSGKPITRTFATVGALRAYAKQRRDAALAALRNGTAR
jgi:phospholipase C